MSVELTAILIMGVLLSGVILTAAWWLELRMDCKARAALLARIDRLEERVERRNAALSARLERLNRRLGRLEAILAASSDLPGRDKSNIDLWN